MKKLAKTWGGDYWHSVDQDVSRANHAYSTYDVDEIFHVFDDL